MNRRVWLAEQKSKNGTTDFFLLSNQVTAFVGLLNEDFPKNKVLYNNIT